MNPRRALLIAGALLASASLHAQVSAVPPAGAQRVIRVTGTGEVRVVPDEAVFTFGIETSDADINKARSDNDARVKELLALTDRLGIARKDVQTDYLNIEPRYDYNGDGRTRQFLGYFTRRNVTIRLRDLSKFEELLSQSLRTGVNYVGQAQFNTSELRKHQDEARVMAARAAREKAEALAGALGVKLGRVMLVEEEAPPVLYPAATFANVRREAQDQQGGGDVLAPGQIVVDARVSVTFEIQ